jgi:hypothetical protein
MKQLKIDDIEYKMKSSFAELTPSEIFKVCHVRSKAMAGEQNEEEFHAMRIVLFTICTNVPWKKTVQITNVQWVDILPHLNWCLEVPKFAGNPILTYRHWFRKYVGPAGKLKHSSIEEMISADNAFVSASNKKDPEMLFLLAAILYRPVRKDLAEFRNSTEWNGDVREPFNMSRSRERVKYFKKLPAHFITYCFLYYWDFRENHLLKFKRVFPKKEQKGSGTNRGWAGTLLELSHLPVFGNIDQLKHQNWYTVIFEMDRQLERAEQREEQEIRNKLNKK